MSTSLQHIDAAADQHTSLVVASGAGLVGVGAVLLGLSWVGIQIPISYVGGGCLVLGLAVLFMGFRAAKSTRYPSPEETFPSISLIEFKAALFAEHRPLCVCTDCLIHLPAQFSTGGCPRCSSSVRYYEINTDDDVDMVMLDLPGAPSESLDAS